MEPLMTLDGYQIIENETESRELLNKFYQQKGIAVISTQIATTPAAQQLTVPQPSGKQI